MGLASAARLDSGAREGAAGRGGLSVLRGLIRDYGRSAIGSFRLCGTAFGSPCQGERETGLRRTQQPSSASYGTVPPFRGPAGCGRLRHAATSSRRTPCAGHCCGRTHRITPGCGRPPPPTPASGSRCPRSANATRHGHRKCRWRCCSTGNTASGRSCATGFWSTCRRTPPNRSCRCGHRPRHSARSSRLRCARTVRPGYEVAVVALRAWPGPL